MRHVFLYSFFPSSISRVSVLIRAFLSSRSPLLAALAALLLLTWLLAHWTWTFLTPRQPADSVSAAAPALSKVWAEKAVHLFGGAGSIGAAVDAAPVAASAIGVSGVYAGRDGRSGFAVLVVDGKALPAVLGQEFAAGLRLQRVYPDSVEILRGGQLEIARMAAPSMPGPGSAAGSAPSLLMSVRSLGPGQYGFSRAELLAMLKRSDQMPLFGRYAPHPRGGAVLERSPAGGLPDKLGLKVGDVVSVINGKPLSGPGDVARLYEQLIKSERVNVEVLRAGTRMNLGIQVAP